MSRQKSCNLRLTNQQGISLIETTISSVILLFILSSSFLIISTTIGSSTVVDKKVELSQKLDSKVDRYLVTGEFKSSSTKSNEFKEVNLSNPKIIKFEAKDKDFNICISKEVLKV